MASFRHGDTILSRWLRRFGASRGTNVSIDGQDYEDNLRAVSIVRDYTTLTEPSPGSSIISAMTRLCVPVAGDFAAVEIRATRAFWVLSFYNFEFSFLYLRDTHLMVSADSPMTVFAGNAAPVNQYKFGGALYSGADAPPAGSYTWDGPRLAGFLPLMPWEWYYVPRGKIMTFHGSSPNINQRIHVITREIPDADAGP